MLSVNGVKTFVGNEGYGFNASLYLNGKKVALAIDDAWGGDYDYHWDGKTPEARNANEQAVREFVAGLPPEKLSADAEGWEKALYPDGERKLELDELVGRLVDEFETEKRLAKQRKTCVLWKNETCGPNEYFKTKHLGQPEATKTAILKKYPTATFL